MSSPHTHMLAPPPEDAERKLNSAIEKNGFQQGQARAFPPGGCPAPLLPIPLVILEGREGIPMSF